MEELLTNLDSTNQVQVFLQHQRLEVASGITSADISRLRTCTRKMVVLTLCSRPALLFVVLMFTTVGTSALPQPHSQPLQRNTSPVGEDDSPQERWEVLYPSISLRDWSIQMLSAPEFTELGPGHGQLGLGEWTPLSQSQTEMDLVKEWPGAWTQRVDNQAKRNIVVADDAAFREKSKLLTAMERQKWLNSYMQKLLVVNSK
ncbi:LOW QUALITY PROTEIN: tuberoinfundibular peptide of 39 residues [Electrophorus electricus]|uniref:LOW QUALITY PROTEIN: tuberoinfundibular peptide of 39 residues n=1 Tax=Electrophorus electricus TaxID=8005 RepID=UPI0015D074EB|nr:LOW QUALITY PROTEIN: tuberoinfundibular peptide of 39 residues [Electrophorus electricus]